MSLNLEQSFWQKCFLFARSQGASKEVAEDFAQNAWIWKFKLEWKTTLAQLWRHHLREVDKLGLKGSLRRDVHLKLKHAKSTTRDFDQGEETPIYETLPAPDTEHFMNFSNLKPLHQMLLLLLQAGWSSQEIAKAFQWKESQRLKALTQLRLSLCLSDEAKEILGENLQRLLSKQEHLSLLLNEKNKKLKDLPQLPEDLLKGALFDEDASS